MRLVPQVLGVVLMLSGGLWALQGLGLLMWPAQSFMLAESLWAIIGGLTFLAGAAFFWVGSRRGR